MKPVAIVAIVAISSMGNDVIHHDCHDSLAKRNKLDTNMNLKQQKHNTNLNH